MIASSLILIAGIFRDLFLAAIPVNFDFATAAVVSFVLVLLGMAAALLLMLKFTGRSVKRKD
jgi:hypothetical protein